MIQEIEGRHDVKIRKNRLCYNCLGIMGILFEGSYRFTKKQVADFYEVDERTLERYLEQNDGELRKNGYEILTGKRLSDAKNLFGPDIDVATKTTV